MKSTVSRALILLALLWAAPAAAQAPADVERATVELDGLPHDGEPDALPGHRLIGALAARTLARVSCGKDKGSSCDSASSASARRPPDCACST
jgi:hypothetical protein